MQVCIPYHSLSLRGCSISSACRRCCTDRLLPHRCHPERESPRALYHSSLSSTSCFRHTLIRFRTRTRLASHKGPSSTSSAFAYSLPPSLTLCSTKAYHYDNSKLRYSSTTATSAHRWIGQILQERHVQPWRPSSSHFEPTKQCDQCSNRYSYHWYARSSGKPTSNAQTELDR
jgi:hypothetical protein